MPKEIKTLKERRIKFTSLVPSLIERAIEMGYDPAIAYVKRCQDCPVGLKNSLHKDCCAIDLDLYDKDGEYITDGEAHRPIGAYWESLHPQCRWGGRFRDGNHYELT